MLRSDTRRLRLPLCAALLATLGFTACSGSSSGDQIAGGSFVVLKTEPADNGRIFLNQSLRIFFSNPVDLSTVNFNSVPFLVRDQLGNPITESVFGTFQHGVDENNDVDPRILEFVPRLPVNDSYTDGGFRPGRTYVVSIVGSASRGSATLRDQGGRPLSVNSPIQSMTFTTASGTTAQDLFVDRTVGGPRVVRVDATPQFGGRLSVGELGSAPVEFAITFNQTVNPASDNVPVGQNLDPVNAKVRDKGDVFLEYDDPQLGTRIWIPGFVELAVNDLQQAVVTIRPDGVLPNNADVHVVVEAEFQDISGESNVNDAAYRRRVATFRTEEQFAAQFAAIVADFESDELENPRATFRDPVAELADGELRASFDFEGNTTPYNFRPTVPVVDLNTEFARVTPSNGPEITVIGGVFRFNDVFIQRGTTVRGSGKNAMVWLTTGDFRVDGELRVDGGDGADVTTLNGANIPTAGGKGACGGGDGGLGSPSTVESSQAGQNGFGPNQAPDGGGIGGDLSCGAVAAAHFGAGGGGGSHATVGDADYVATIADDAQANGNGGEGVQPVGGQDAAIAGGLAGDTILIDDDNTNDFWGRQVDADGAVIFGEIVTPLGGSGGGGGGDRTKAANCLETNFFNDEKGGGGGAGAGVLIVKALGRITIGPKGIITANGGNGGGGENEGSSLFGGGGGGGSGGMIVLSSSQGIDIYQHTGLWKDKDTDFAITADGGIGRSLDNANMRATKYGTIGGRPNRGGYGGMGIVQLMAPAGDDSDNTMNPQDDNIRYLDSAGNPLPGPQKMAALDRGEIRPNPIIMPVTYGRNSTFESRFIATGASVRQVVSSSLGAVRATTTRPEFDPQDSEYGPDWFFHGIEKSGANAGFIRTDTSNGRQVQSLRSYGSMTRFAVSSAEANSLSYRGLDAHRVRLGSAILPSDGSAANTVARLLNANSDSLGQFRVLGHTDRELYLDVRDGDLPSGVANVEILDKFFEVFTDGAEGLGPIYDLIQGNQTLRYPVANVQIGFAFHKDPSSPDIVNQNGVDIDRNRYPQQLDGYVYDLETTGASSMREELRKLHYGYAKFRVRFDLNHNPANPSEPGPNVVSPTTQRPALRFLRLPFRF